MMCINLRRLISYSVRVVDVSEDDIVEMESAAQKLFRLCCKYDNNITPSLWTFCNAAPVHAKHLLEKLGLGLGANSMEGREQKHQKIKCYMQNTSVQQRWQYVFRHEFISCVYLRENGFDQRKYNKKCISYIPIASPSHCIICGMQITDGFCEICNGVEYAIILKDIN